MLLEHKAGIWWQGVKESISSFDAAIEALRCAFGHDTKYLHTKYTENCFPINKKKMRIQIFL